MRLRTLLLEDNPDDARLVEFELEANGFQPECQRVSCELDYLTALQTRPDIILADYTLPGFGAESALRLLKESGLAIPLIVITGSVGEDKAVACMREGAADYLLKDRLTRLGPAVRRALEEAQAQAAKRVADEELRDSYEFVALLTQISSKLIHAEDPEAAVIEALGELSVPLGFARAEIRVRNELTDSLDIAHEWCAPGVSSLRENGAALTFASVASLVPAALTGEVMVLRTAELPPALDRVRELAEQDRVHTIVAVPLPAGGVVSGNLGFHYLEPPSKLASAVANRLGLFGQIIANWLARMRSEQQRREAFEQVAQLKRAAEQERDYLREELHGAGLERMVGESTALKHAQQLVQAVAKTKASVLIHGESGVGKELFAQAIHAQSDRAMGPLVKVNCASIPKELFESEFFGHVKGSFTGALRNRTGRFELANGGSIFLDEVGEIPLEMQAKLLRVLQESEFERVGDDRTSLVDVRVIAASNRDLELDVAAGAFRRDLYYRLNVFPLKVPPLRDRGADVVLLAEFFLSRCCRELCRPPLLLTPEHRRLLESYTWPGNVRELSHVIERAVILSPTPPLRLDLALATTSPAPPAAASPQLKTDAELRDLERSNLLLALERSQWRISGRDGAATLLGLSPSTLRDRMRALGIERHAS
jgi:transcriptional regulator with GAF, ATPase, and Fis domain